MSSAADVHVTRPMLPGLSFRKLVVFWLMAVCLQLPTGRAFCCAEESTTPLPEREQFHLYLLIGQSNMAGRGKVEDQDRQPHPRVLTFNQAQEWVPAIDPLHFDKPSVVGVGIGKTFGEILAERQPGVTIGLIPCAVGGSPIETWEPGAYDAATKTHPYDDMLKRCQVALPAGTLKGFLWHQGESDANATRAPLYEKRLHALITRLRTEFDAEQVPFLVGQMGQFPDAPWNEYKQQVDAVHRRLPQQVPLTAYVSATDLTHKGDKVHFSADAYRKFGRRYAAEYLKLLGEQ